MNHKKSTI